MEQRKDRDIEKMIIRVADISLENDNAKEDFFAANDFAVSAFMSYLALKAGQLYYLTKHK